MLEPAAVSPPRPTTTSLTGRRWRVPAITWQPTLGARRPGSPAPWARELLAARGIADPRAQARYMRPLLADLDDPRAIADMDRAVARLQAALAGGEPVVVYGDYDVDGVAATVVMVEALAAVGLAADFHIPERRREGYGLNLHAVEALARRYRLIVSVDCGVTAEEEVQAARRLGCDVIVVDHHQVPDRLPEASAVLDPQRHDCRFPFKGMCAAGVAFMLAVCLRRALRDAGGFAARDEPDLRPLLDVVALATVADMVPMQATNRVLTAAGLLRMRQSPRVGLRALAEVAGVDLARAQVADLGFRLGPRINARGRMSDARLGVELLMCRDPARARALATACDVANRQRQEVERTTVAEAIAEVLAQGWQAGSALVVANPAWHPGVIGLVASRLAARFGLPTVVIGEGGRGSARSALGVDLFAALRSVAEHLQRFGGHRAAAGCQVLPERVEGLRAALCQAVAADLGPPPYTVELAPEVRLPHSGLDLELCGELERLGPFGQGNPEPLFVTHDLEVLGRRRVGDSHLKLRLTGGAEAIGFGMGDLIDAVGRRVDALFHVHKSDFGGRVRAEMRLVDLAHPAAAGISAAARAPC